MWTHHFIIQPAQWHAFYRHCRTCRQTSEYSIIRDGDYVSVLG